MLRESELSTVHLGPPRLTLFSYLLLPQFIMNFALFGAAGNAIDMPYWWGE